MKNEEDTRKDIVAAVEEVLKSLQYFKRVTSYILPTTTKETPFAYFYVTERPEISSETPVTTQMEYQVKVHVLIKNDPAKDVNANKAEIMYKMTKAFKEHYLIGWWDSRRISFMGEFFDIDFMFEDDVADNLLEISLGYKFKVSVLDGRPD